LSRIIDIRHEVAVAPARSERIRRRRTEQVEPLHAVRVAHLRDRLVLLVPQEEHGLHHVHPRSPADRCPYLNEAAADLLASGYDSATEFEVGLDLMLEALEALRTGSAP